MNGLNEKELEILRFVKDCIERDGYAPAVRDICHALGIRSTSTVWRYRFSDMVPRSSSRNASSICSVI